jgi:hypothetical protein
MKKIHSFYLYTLYTASLISTKPVIPAKAGIQRRIGFRATVPPFHGHHPPFHGQGWWPWNGGMTALGREPGMKNGIRFMSLCIILATLFFLVSPMSQADNRNFIDEVGRKVSIPFPPKSIVSLAPNITEILFSLGLDDYGCDVWVDKNPISGMPRISLMKKEAHQ